MHLNKVPNLIKGVSLVTFLAITLGIIVVCALLTYGNHVRTKKQYTKKEHIDHSLYKEVLKRLDEHLPLQKAINRFNIHHDTLLQSIQHHTNFPLTQNDRIKLLVNSEEKFPALFAEIENAKHHIHVLYYTIRDDEIGSELLRRLREKAKQGVEIRILVDGIGSKDFINSDSFKQLNEEGIHCKAFAPPKLSFLFHLNFRNHRKIVVIDGRVAFTGGLNVGDEYEHKDPKKGYWRDMHLLIEGESVLLLQRMFATDWYYVTEEKIKEDNQYFPQFTKEGTQTEAKRTALAQVIPSGPDMKQFVARDVYRDMIHATQRMIWLATPYFIPDKTIQESIIKIAQQGKEVLLLVPKKTDNPLVQHAAYHYYEQLLKAGVQIYLYEKGFYHGKVALVDDIVTKVGSVNMDQRSFHYSFEVGVFMYHEQTAQRMKEIFEEDLAVSTKLTQEDIKQRSWWKKALTPVCLLFARWL